MSDNITTLAGIAKDAKTAMMTTVTADGHLHARPMTAHTDELSKGKIWFIGHKQTETVANLEQNPQVNLCFVHDKDYASINGTAKFVNDDSKLDELWSPIASAFFEKGREDDNITLICVDINGAEYWQAGNTLVSLFKIATSVFGQSTATDMGDNETVKF